MSTYLLFGVRTCMPLLLLPILSHRVGRDEFGVVLAVQSLGLLGSVLTEYGFHYAAARELGLANDGHDIARIVSRTFFSQLLLAALTLIIVGLSALLTPVLSASPVAIVSAILIAVATGLAPVWYFRGVGKASWAIAIEAFGQFVALGLMFCLVRAPRDAPLAMSFMAIGPCCSFVLGYAITLRRGVAILRVRMSDVLSELRAVFSLFLVRAGSSFYTVAAIWITALLSSTNQVAYYGVASKLGGLLVALYQPVSHVMVPRAARLAQEAPGLLRREAVRWGSCMVVFGLIVVAIIHAVIAPVISLALGDDMRPAIAVAEVLSWVCVTAALKEAASCFYLIPYRQDRLMSASVIAAGLLNLGLAYVLVPAKGAMGMAWSRLICELFIVVVFLAFAIFGAMDWRRTSPRPVVD
ncbi:oligosaccharide flippase family protein [Dyella sp. C11]|uniref:oligosaccharide flippase family protein n=1 Tax=Dyella sp. C11 TaxID=2126991 RepID=UPI00130031D0|nr:oligosaccharide flippase family protein [Dyella sp. C11]